MAFGFIKKIFSFGKKDEQVEEAAVPAIEALAAEAPVVEALVEQSVAMPEPIAETVQPEIVAPRVQAPVVAEAKVEIRRPAQRKPVELKPVDLKARRKVSEPPAEAEPLTPEKPKPDPVTVQEPTPVEIAPEPVPVAPTLQPIAIETPKPVEPKSELVQPEAVKPEPQKLAVGKTVEAVAAPVEAAPLPKVSWFQRLKSGLSRSSRELSDSITGIFTKRKLDEETLQDLEDVLIRADLGLETAMRVTDTLSSGRYGKEVSGSEVRAVMAAEIEKVLAPVAKPLELDLSHKPHVILVVGVNGTGKTTTIGKLAAKLTNAGLKVTLAAGDTFRAAAIEQLKIWGERTKSTVVSSKLGADAAGLAFDAYEKAKAEGADVLIIDTAGRLQNKTELMDELAKIVRVLGRIDADAPHTVLQTLDATTGQNALNQVEIFRNIAGVNGLVMTKLDGTARGGILVAIAAKHKLPVYFIGVGEQIDDLEPFSAHEFAEAIAGGNVEEGLNS
jgi:fused signal recognition particle receptor